MRTDPGTPPEKVSLVSLVSFPHPTRPRPREGAIGRKQTNQTNKLIQEEAELTPRDGGLENAVRVLLADPPGGLVEQLARCRQDPGLIRPTCSTISYKVYGTSARWGEIQPILEEALQLIDAGASRA